MGFIGLVYLGSALWSLVTGGLNALHVLVSAAVFAGTFLIIKAMKIKQRLNEYDNKLKDLPFTGPFDPGQKDDGYTPDWPKKAA